MWTHLERQKGGIGMRGPGETEIETDRRIVRDRIALLKDKIKIRSQRDLGWQVYKEDDQYDVERAFLMNKSMQLRFRWHVNKDGTIAPDGKRAESLCSK